MTTRKIIFTCTAAIIVAAVGTSSAYARGFGGGGFRGLGGGGFHGLGGGRPGGIGAVHVNPGLGAHHTQMARVPGGLRPIGGGLPGGGHHGGGDQPPGIGLPGGGHHGGGREPPPIGLLGGGDPGCPALVACGGDQPPGVGHYHHGHQVFRDGIWIYVDGPADDELADVTPAALPGPCTCLTKTYTPSGLVVFADICTKESVSAPATDDFADASKAPSTAVTAMATPISEVPTVPNYAGRTYQDYLTANPELVRPQTSMQTSEQNQPEK
jgi:hypothetical protein